MESLIKNEKIINAAAGLLAGNFANNANNFSNDWEIIQSIYILFFDC